VTAISYHASINDVQAQQLAAAGPFARREWFARLEKTLADPVYAVANDSSGTVVLPLRRNGRRLESLLNWYGFTWRPLATPFGSLDSLTIALAGGLAARTSHIVLDRVPDEDRTARQLERAFQRAGWHVVREPCDTNRVLAVDGRDYAAYLEGRHQRTTRESSEAKLYSSEVAVRVAEDCVQIHGGYGFVKDYPAEKYFRDVKLLTIGEGTSEIQRLVIARQLLKD